MLRGINIIREIHKQGHTVGTTRLYERKSTCLGRGIGKEPKVSANCKNNKCGSCTMLQCNHICHDDYRIR